MKIGKHLIKVVKATFAIHRINQIAIGDRVIFWGKSFVRQKKARRGRNPQTREALTLGTRKVLVFKASGVLRQRMNKK